MIKFVSFVIPAKDEQDTLVMLVDGIRASCAEQGISAFEIILIDDGSKDRSWPIMEELAQKHPGEVKVFRLRRNFGKAIALNVGFKVARGDVVFTMDADLQDDPKEIGRFIAELESGYDLVSGWKARRHDPLSKTLPSKVFNKITARVSGVKLHDFNCGFKAYRREVLKHIRLYGELHRYIPVLAHDAGFRIGEIEVHHHPRRHGKSKYGFERYVRGFLDLVTVLTTTRYLQRPGHLFGGLGVLAGLIGAAILGYLSILWLFNHPIGDRPLLQLGSMMAVLSVQMISIGAIGELIVRMNKSENPPRRRLRVCDRRIDSRVGGGGVRHACVEETVTPSRPHRHAHLLGS